MVRLASVIGLAALLGTIAGAVHHVRVARARAAAARMLPAERDALELRVPHAQGAITLDGDTGRRRVAPCYLPARELSVSSDGVNAARPHSEARFVWGDGHLYVEFYAADQDIHANHETADGPVWESDSFHLVLSDGKTEHSFDVSPLGTLTDGERSAAAAVPGSPRPFDYAWNSGAHISHEIDGTPNRTDDDDEEWVIEMAIPFDALGLAGVSGEKLGASIRRCDTLKSGVRSCGSWGDGEKKGLLVLE